MRIEGGDGTVRAEGHSLEINMFELPQPDLTDDLSKREMTVAPK